MEKVDLNYNIKMSWLKSRRVLTERQLSKVKTSFVLLGFIICVQGVVVAANYYYQGEEYDKMQVKLFPRGRIVEYTNLEEFCDR